MSEKIMQETKEAVGALRDAVEKYGQDSAEVKAMIEKTNAALEAGEKRHQELVAKQAEQEKLALDADERVKDLEKQIVAYQSSGGSKADFRESEAYKALNLYASKGLDALTADQKGILDQNTKTLRMDSDTAGGYLTTTEMDTQIIKSITEMSPVRQVARVRSVSKKTLEIVKRTSIPTATYEGETQAGSESESAYGNEQLTTFRLTTTVPFTLDLLGDSSFDLMSEITGDVNEAFAYTEGNKFVLGTGEKQPEGFLVNAANVAAAKESASSGVLTGDDLINLTGELKVGYNPMFAFNRQTLAYIRTLKDSAGNYIWQPGLAPGNPNSIMGESYIIMQDMPDIAAAALAVAYADFMRGYTITDRTGTAIIRDDFTSKKKAIVEMTFHRWNTGQVVLSEAFKLLKIKS